MTAITKDSIASLSRCDELIEVLHAEVESVNVPEVMKSLADMLLGMRFSSPVPPALLDFVEKLPNVRTVPEYLKLFELTDSILDGDKYSSWPTIRSRIFRNLPLGMLIRDLEIVEDVEFAHTLPKQRAEDIEESGVIYGRSTPSRLTLTRQFFDLYVPNDGFIFAYDLDSYLNEDPVVMFSTYLSGEAYYAVRFWFYPDGERQLIIPVSCISKYQVDEWPSEYAPMEGWHDEYAYELPHPSRWTAGAVRECDECEAEFALDAGAIVGRDLLCKKCRP